MTQGEPPKPGILTEALLLHTYGPRLTLRELAEVLKINSQTIRNQMHAGTFPIPTYVEGGKRYADYRAVAEHVDECFMRAEEEAAELRRRAQERGERHAARRRRLKDKKEVACDDGLAAKYLAYC